MGIYYSYHRAFGFKLDLSDKTGPDALAFLTYCKAHDIYSGDDALEAQWAFGDSPAVHRTIDITEFGDLMGGTSRAHVLGTYDSSRSGNVQHGQIDIMDVGNVFQPQCFDTLPPAKEDLAELLDIYNELLSLGLPAKALKWYTGMTVA